ARDRVERNTEVIKNKREREAVRALPACEDYSTTMSGAPSTNATTTDRLTAVLSYGVLLLLIYLVFRIYEPFLTALGWAAILVIFFYPMHQRLLRRFSSVQAAVTSTLAVTILLTVPPSLVATLFWREPVSIWRGVQISIVDRPAPRLAGRG